VATVVAAATAALHAKLFLSCMMHTFLSFVFDFYYLLDTLETSRARTIYVCVYACVPIVY